MRRCPNCGGRGCEHCRGTGETVLKGPPADYVRPMVDELLRRREANGGRLPIVEAITLAALLESLA